MPSIKIISCFLFLLITQIGFSQRELLTEIPDSLKDKSYEELTNKINNIDISPDNIFIYANTYVLKARKEKDLKNIAEGFTFLHDFYTNYKLQEVFLDSLIWYGEKLNIPKYMGIAYYYKGERNQYQYRNYYKALDYYLKSIKYATLADDVDIQFETKRSIGDLKSKTGDYSDALLLFREYYIYIKNKFKKNKNYRYKYLSSLVTLSGTFNKNREVDSASYYLKIGIKESLKYKNDKNSVRMYNHMLFSYGINQYLAKNYNVAIDSLKKNIKGLSDVDDKINLGINFSYIGKAYNKRKEFDEAAYYFEKMDSMIQITNFMDFGTRNSYEHLINYYKQKNKKNKQLKIIEKLLKIDKKFYGGTNSLVKDINEKYDIPKLVTEKERLIKSLKQEKKRSNIGLVIVIGILIVFGGFLSYYFRKQKFYKKRFENIMSDKHFNSNQRCKNMNKKSLDGISQKIINQIKNKLQEFEEKHEFLNSSITLNSLSKKINTNSNYLSKVINFYEQKNFSNYINNLRIEYTIIQLKTNIKFRRYSVKGMAKEVGFNSPESFSKAFYKRAGLYPSYFLKRLEKNDV